MGKAVTLTLTNHALEIFFSTIRSEEPSVKKHFVRGKGQTFSPFTLEITSVLSKTQIGYTFQQNLLPLRFDKKTWLTLKLRYYHIDKIK